MNRIEKFIIIALTIYFILLFFGLFWLETTVLKNKEKECLKCYEKGSNQSLLEIDSILHQKVLSRRNGDTNSLLNLRIVNFKKQDTITYYIY